MNEPKRDSVLSMQPRSAHTSFSGQRNPYHVIQEKSGSYYSQKKTYFRVSSYCTVSEIDLRSNQSPASRAAGSFRARLFFALQRTHLLLRTWHTQDIGGSWGPSCISREQSFPSSMEATQEHRGVQRQRTQSDTAEREPSLTGILFGCCSRICCTSLQRSAGDKEVKKNEVRNTCVW